MFAVGETDCVPDIALAPDQPPLAVQDVALVEDQVRVEDWPLVMLEGEAEIDAVGAGETLETVTLIFTAVAVFPAASRAVAVKV